MKTEKDILLRRIANHLILHSIDMEDIGLFHGKMGGVLFFAHYARYTDQAIYDDFAGELLEEICENIPETLPINLETGLCGIGWGIEYLIQNGFMDGNSNEILAVIDQKVMERDLRRIKDLSLETGLMGISCYISLRLSSLSGKAIEESFDTSYLSEWRKVTNRLKIWDKQETLNYLLSKQPKGNNIPSWNLCLINGCAGVGIKYLTEKN